MPRPTKEINLPLAQKLIDEISVTRPTWGGYSILLQEVANAYNAQQGDSIQGQLLGLRVKAGLLRVNIRVDRASGGTTPMTAEHKAKLLAGKQAADIAKKQNKKTGKYPVCKRDDGSIVYPGTTYEDRLRERHTAVEADEILGGSRKAAVNAFCKKCCGDNMKSVKYCTAYACALWLFRPTKDD